MQSTGQTSTQALSLVLMQASVMTYGMIVLGEEDLVDLSLPANLGERAGDGHPAHGKATSRPTSPMTARVPATPRAGFLTLLTCLAGLAGLALGVPRALGAQVPAGAIVGFALGHGHRSHAWRPVALPR